MTRYLNLAEYFVLAELVTEVPAETLTKAGRVDLADSALHAPPLDVGSVTRTRLPHVRSAQRTSREVG